MMYGQILMGVQAHLKMKKIFLIIFLGMFLINFVQAVPDYLNNEELTMMKAQDMFKGNCQIEFEGETGIKTKIFEKSYMLDLTCSIIQGQDKIKKQDQFIKDLQTNITDLENRITQLETIVSQLTGTEIPKIETENKKQDEAICSIKLFDWCLIK
jgi:peptidoglycan hydrolase CwlO-like protein